MPGNATNTNTDTGNTGGEQAMLALGFLATCVLSGILVCYWLRRCNRQGQKKREAARQVDSPEALLLSQASTGQGETDEPHRESNLT